MKTIQAIILGASIILVSSNSIANTIGANGNQRSETNTISMTGENTKQAAFKSGASKLSQLKSASADQLSKELRVNSSNLDGTTLHLKSAGYVSVQERMDANGNISFIPLVNVGIHYAERPD